MKMLKFYFKGLSPQDIVSIKKAMKQYPQIYNSHLFHDGKTAA